MIIISCKISIIVPVYNVENYLPKCIDSILNQNFGEFELILVDDGSVDSSGNICDYYCSIDDRIKVIHLENGGVSRARNIGISNSEGKYIMFCDSDDYIDIECCKNMYINIQNNENAFITSGYVVVNQRVNPTSYILHSMELDDAIVNLKKSEFYILYERNLLNSVCNKIYSSDLLKQNNIYFDEKVDLGEDLLFNLNYLQYSNEDIIIINKSLYYYILRNKDSLDHKYQKNLFEKYKYISESLYDAMIMHNVDMNKYERLHWKKCYFRFESIFKNTFHKSNNQNWVKKMNYNNKICKTDLFKNSINYLTEEDVEIAYLNVLKCKNYYLIYLYKILKHFKYNYKYYIKSILINMKIIKDRRRMK